MDHNATLGENHIDALNTVYLVFLTPSVIGSFSVLVVSIVRWRHLNEQVHLLVQLALADFLAAVMLIVTSVLNKISIEKSIGICPYTLPLALTFYFISFLLVLLYAWKSKSTIQGWRTRPTEEQDGPMDGSRQKRISLVLYAIVWTIPIALYVVYVLPVVINHSEATDTSVIWYIQKDSTYCTKCILFLHVSGDLCSNLEEHRSMIMRVLLIFTVISVMLSSSVIHYKSGKWYQEQRQEWLFPVEGDGRSGSRIKSMLSTARNMVIVILFCWTPALVLILLSQTGLPDLFGLYVLQAATVSLHGFLNSMVYAWRRPNFTVAVLGESTPLVGYQHLAFFDESLKSINTLKDIVVP